MNSCFIQPFGHSSAEYTWRIRELLVMLERRSALARGQGFPLESFRPGASSAVAFFWRPSPLGALSSPELNCPIPRDCQHLYGFGTSQISYFGLCPKLNKISKHLEHHAFSGQNAQPSSNHPDDHRRPKNPRGDTWALPQGFSL